MAVRFDATGEDYTSTSSPPAGSAFTIVCWVKISTDRNTWSAAWSSDSSTSNYSYLSTDSDGTTMKWWTLVGGNERTINGPNMSMGTWYRFAAVCNGANATLYYGTASGSLSTGTSATWQTLATSTTFRVGADPFSGEWLNGAVAALKHYSTDLTQAEVERELAQYLPSRTANLVRIHPFITNETADYSGNGRTLSGGTGTAREDGPPIPWRTISPRLILPATASGQVALDGTGTAAASATGSAAVSRPLDSSAPASSGVTGALSADRPITGNANAAASATADASATRALDASSPSASSASGDVSRAAGLTGSGDASASLTGAVDVTRPLTATTAAASNAAGSLETARPIDGAANSASGATGDLSIAGQVTLDGTSQAAASATGSLSSTRLLDAFTPTSSDASGALTVARSITGSAPASSSAAADLGVFSDVLLDGIASAVADLDGTLFLERTLTTSTAVAGWLTGDVLLARGLDSSASGANTATGVLLATRPVTANAATASSATATLSVSSPNMEPSEHPSLGLAYTNTRLGEAYLVDHVGSGFA